MAIINFEQMKTDDPTRNFDSSAITNDYNIGAQNAQGLYGAFKFFHGIKSFFKGISALGTLASGSKLLVTDDNGNVSYTTPATIKSTLSLVDTTSLNGALVDYNNYKDTRNTNELPNYYYTNFKNRVVYEFKTSSVIGLSNYTYTSLTTYVDWKDTAVKIYQKAICGNKTYTRTTDSSNTGWLDWQEVITETSLSGALTNQGIKLTFTPKSDLTFESCTVNAVRIGKVITMFIDLRKAVLGNQTVIGEVNLDNDIPVMTSSNITNRSVIYQENAGVREPIFVLSQFNKTSNIIFISLQNKNTSSIGTPNYIFGTFQFIFDE